MLTHFQCFNTLFWMLESESAQIFWSSYWDVKSKPADLCFVLVFHAFGLTYSLEQLLVFGFSFSLLIIRSLSLLVQNKKLNHQFIISHLLAVKSRLDWWFLVQQQCWCEGGAGVWYNSCKEKNFRKRCTRRLEEEDKNPTHAQTYVTFLWLEAVN